MSAEITIAQKELKQLSNSPAVQEAFNKILGENGPAFIASMLTAVNTSDNLKFCAPMSVVNSALLAASLNLPIEQSLGQAWIIPYRRDGVQYAQFQIGYKGLIQLALRSGEYRKINAAVVPVGVEVRHNFQTGDIDLIGSPTGEDVQGYMSYLELLNGYSHTVYMTKAEVEAHAERYSKSWNKGQPHEKSAWATNFNDMALKTVLKKNLTKYGILSIKMVRAIAVDDTPMEKINMQDLQPIEGEVTEPKPAREKQSREQNMKELTGQAEQTVRQALSRYEALSMQAKGDISGAWKSLVKSLNWDGETAHNVLKECDGDIEAAFTKALEQNRELLA